MNDPKLAALKAQVENDIRRGREAIKARRQEIEDEKKATFLALMAESGKLIDSANKAKVESSKVYAWMKDAAFKQACIEAYRQGELRQRGGVPLRGPRFQGASKGVNCRGPGRPWPDTPWTPQTVAMAQADLDAGMEDADVARNYGLTVTQIYNAVNKGTLKRDKKKTGPKPKWVAPKCPEVLK